MKIRAGFVPRFQLCAAAPLALGIALTCSACGGDDGPMNSTGVDAGGSDAVVVAGDIINAASLKACPQAATFIQTTEWLACLAGKRIAGVEPFNNQSCELRIGANGVVEYLRSGAVALRIPERSAWRAATGTYQNSTTSGPSSTFFASIAPDYAPVDGQVWVTDISLTFLNLLDDKVEVKYFDAARARQTYNCTVNVL